MQPLPLHKFRINKRRVAATWGSDHKALATTDRRVSWYDCSSHGGFIADPKDFSPEELAKLGSFASGNYDVYILVATHRTTREPWVLAAQYEDAKPRNRRYDPYTFENPQWIKYPVMLFEEDQNWAVLTHKLGVKCKSWLPKWDKEPDKYQQILINTLQHGLQDYI